jgi:hypothetical protein
MMDDKLIGYWSDEPLYQGFMEAAGQNVLHKPATVLQLDQPISLGTVGDRFSFKRELGDQEQDPTTNSR